MINYDIKNYYCEKPTSPVNPSFYLALVRLCDVTPARLLV